MSHQTREEILQVNLLTRHLEKQGIKLRGSGRQRQTNHCALAKHREQHLCVSIDTEDQLWHCNDCGRGGSLIDWLMCERNQSAADVLKSFNGNSTPPTSPSRNGAPVAEKPTTKRKVVATYDYVDESLQLRYQAVRFDPKGFNQRRPDGHGGWIWSMEGVTRLLFNLPAVIKATTVAIAEGEKDCQTLGKFDIVATCNVGGAGKWLQAYGERLKGKDVLVFPDNDAAGTKHADEVVTSLDKVANSIKKIVVPEPHKDVTEWLDAFTDHEKAKLALVELISKTSHLLKPLPIYTIAEMEQHYRESFTKLQENAFDLGKFLPDLRRHIRPMVPGEVLLMLADTGVGKTMLMQHMLRAAGPLPALLFELELPMNLVFERFVQMEIRCHSSDVEKEYRELVAPVWQHYKGLHHITVCPESGLTTDQIEQYIVRSELKLGRRPVVVGVDYVGLLNQRQTRSRYEAVSKAAEDLKVIAKNTGTIVLLASQVTRPDNKKGSLEVGLHDGKDSGALECSAGVVLGAWRPEKNLLKIKILKNTSGTSGETIEARVDGARMSIRGDLPSDAYDGQTLLKELEPDKSESWTSSYDNQ